MEPETNNYVLVLFEKDRDSIPKIVGQKKLPKHQYMELTDPVFKTFMVGEIMWHIKERRFFFRKDSSGVNYFVIIDAQRDHTPTTPNKISGEHIQKMM